MADSRNTSEPDAFAVLRAAGRIRIEDGKVVVVPKGQASPSRCIPPEPDRDGYWWVRRWRAPAPAIPLHWTTEWHKNAQNGWGQWSQPDREDQWEVLGPVAPLKDPDVALYDRALTTFLAKEVDRLRATLTELQQLGEQGMKPDYGEWLTFHDKVAQIAREALQHGK